MSTLEQRPAELPLRRAMEARDLDAIMAIVGRRRR